jgi:hypothetical protein
MQDKTKPPMAIITQMSIHIEGEVMSWRGGLLLMLLLAFEARIEVELMGFGLRC